MSAGDLENIIESETPPQSPALFSSETQPLISSSRRRCSIIVGIDEDEDDDDDAKMSDQHHQSADEEDVLSSKAPASVEPVHSPASSLPSSPQPNSLVAFSVCPLRLGKTFAFTSADAEVRPVNSAAEAFIQRQQEQVGRIAEYNKRTSLISEAHLAVSVALTALALLHSTTFITKPSAFEQIMMVTSYYVTVVFDLPLKPNLDSLYPNPDSFNRISP